MWKKGQRSIQCDKCLLWVHGPSEEGSKSKKNKSCSLLTLEEFNSFDNIENENLDWFCPTCEASMLPFCNVKNETLFNDQLEGKISNDVHIIPEGKFKTFIEECNSMHLELEESENESEETIFHNIKSKYYDILDFNNIKPDSGSTFGIMHVNLASLNLHFDDLKLILSLLKYKFDIIAITEHKLLRGIGATSNIDLDGYNPFVFEEIDTTHGGTGFYINKTLDFIRRDDLAFNSPGDYSSSFIELIFPNKKNKIIGCVYRHPSSSQPIEDFSKQCIEPVLEKINSENKICILNGDFNINLLKSDQHEDSSYFYNCLTSNGFAPYILQPTRPVSKSLIDNIFINSLEYKSYSGNLTTQIADHLIQFVLLEGFYKPSFPIRQTIYQRNFKHFNEREFYETLENFDWEYELMLNLNDSNKSLENLFKKINFFLDESAPYKKLNKKEIQLKQKPWINKDILTKIYERDKLLRKYCNLKDPTRKENIYAQYKALRNSITNLKRQAKVEYYRNFFELNKSNSKKIWKGIRSIVNINSNSQGHVKLLNENDKFITDQKKIANSFNKYFVNVGPDIDKTIPKSIHNYQDYLSDLKNNKTFFMSPTNSKEVFDIIASLDINKSTGPNSIPVYILKVYNNFFSENLSKIINISFSTGVFPDLCKIAKVIPIFKKDNQLQCGNYRPISLLSVFSKIFEKVIYTRMYSFLEKNKLIYDHQFGFRANHSTNHAVINLTELIKSYRDSGNTAAGIFIDLQKAFDTVNHKILCGKLNYYGFRGKSLELISSFLCGRKQFVSINGHNSSYLDITCGVPQGSTLGPLLFLIYINDLRYCLKYAVASHFADDTCLLYANKNLKSLETNLNYDLKSCSEWLKSNRLSLNIKKTELLLFHSKSEIPNQRNISIKLMNKRIEPSLSVKYLGLHIDNKLSWNYHIKRLSKTLSRANGILSKLRHFAPKSTLISVYNSIFYSHILYGCSSWSLTSLRNQNLITILQKKCLRIMNFAPFRSHTNELFKKDSILKCKDIYEIEKLKVVFDYKANLLPSDLMNLFTTNRDIHSHDTRNDRLHVPQINTTMHGLNSLKYSACILWNDHLKINNNINKLTSTTQFKSYLKKYYISKY